MKIKEKIWRTFIDKCEHCGKNLSIFEKEVMDDYRKRDKRFSKEEREEIICFSCLTKRIYEKHLASIDTDMMYAIFKRKENER